MTTVLDTVRFYLRLASATSLMLFALCASALAQGFPLEFEHKFGTTFIPEKPERVASVDFSGVDDLLALGVQPVTIRHWRGDYAHIVWPWAEPLLKHTPTILQRDLDFEAIAAAKPDIIIALRSGIDAAEYEKLSLIAPVVPVPIGVGDYALPWSVRALLTGKVIGKLGQATLQVDTIRAKLIGIAEKHPDWAGKTAAVAFARSGPDRPGAFTSSDIRSQLLAEIGFATPSAVDALAAGEQSARVRLSPEDLSPIDADLVIWISDGNWENITGLKGRPLMKSAQQGREVFAGQLLTSAFSNASLLSLPYALDRMLPMLEAALDGDPKTHADDRPADL